MKSGWKTSEFWVSFFVIIGSTAAVLMDHLDPKYAVIASSISSLAYAISRGLSKKNEPALTVVKD